MSMPERRTTKPAIAGSTARTSLPQLAETLDYIPMPKAAVAIFEESWQQIKGPDGKPVWDGRGS